MTSGYVKLLGTAISACAVIHRKHKKHIKLKIIMYIDKPTLKHTLNQHTINQPFRILVSYNMKYRLVRQRVV